MSQETRRPEVLCIGFGALGTIYSYLLAQGGASITAVARSNYTTLTTTGIHIDSLKYGSVAGWKPTRCVGGSDPEAARDRVYDYVVCTFKNVPDHQSASSVIRPFLRKGEGRGPTIVLLQNGVGIEDEVQRSLVEEEGLARGVISAVAWIGANLVDGGTRVTHGALERLEFGSYSPSGQTEEDKVALDQFAKIYLAGGGGGKAVDDIEAIRWQKILWNASWGGLSTLARQPVAALLTPDTLHYSVGVVRRIMLEILYVARACGIGEERFPASSVDQAVNITLKTSQIQGVGDGVKGGNLAADFKPSILLDLENGRPMELEPIVGNVVRMARRTGVDTPRLDLILASLKPSQVQAIEKAGGGGEGEGVTKFEQLSATSRGNWPAGAPVSKDSRTYL